MNTRAALLWLLPVACADPMLVDASSPPFDAAVIDDAALFDAASPIDDAGIEDAGIEDVSPVEPTALPLGLDSVITIGEPGAIDMYGAAVEADGAVTVYYERYDEPFTTGRFYSATSTGAAAFSAPEEVALGTRALRGSPSVIGDRFYFVEADSISGPPAIEVSAISGGALGAPIVLDPIAGLASLLSWPRFLALEDGRTAVVFRDAVGRGTIGFSDDGLTFPGLVGTGGGALAQPELGQAEDGTLAFAFQRPVANEPMVSFIQLSSDGTTWSTPARTSTSSSNVHDARLFRRIDGALDAYYIYPASVNGFSLFRRRIASSGDLGPEQNITLPEIGDTSKPAPQRLRDGRILLLYAEITARAPQGYPSEQVLKAVLILGDAPE